MVLFGRLRFDRRLLNNVIFRSIRWETKGSWRLIAFAWAITKGDWWKNRDEESAKFFSVEWRRQSDEFIRSGLYIGRIALVYQTRLNI